MDTYCENTMEFADFMFERQKVVCYGLKNNMGGTTTILNFPSRALADEFVSAFLRGRAFDIVRNDAQVICLADYDRVMRRSDDDPRVRFLNYNRDFMMGTLAHVV
ncbi:hypothetical protein SAMN05421759_10779 [Roseivivax lentus]|uniref:Uncharacterized protein n=1 Tax=Roseivivax lentus TaxID=633194 RepID=A0A1N7N8R2_9RHOB|nr:hypothetical protein [Roseivivax lentus]SIS94735.1 hypothetical protein SAMN05421759_10779 [Roseivivax lentus]